MLSPVLLAATLAVIGSGIGLAVTGPAPPLLLALHKVSFLVWLVTIVVHLIAYVWRVPHTIASDWASSPNVIVAPWRAARLLVNLFAIGGAAVAAVVLTSLDRNWLQWFAQQGETGLGIAVLVVFLIIGVGAAYTRQVWTTTPT